MLDNDISYSIYGPNALLFVQEHAGSRLVSAEKALKAAVRSVERDSEVGKREEDGLKVFRTQMN